MTAFRQHMLTEKVVSDQKHVNPTFSADGRIKDVSSSEDATLKNAAMSNHWILPGRPILPIHTLDETRHLIDQLELCTGEEQLADLMVRFVEPLGATNILVGTMPQFGASKRQQIGHILINAWPNDWSARYFTRNYLFQDPTIRLVRRGVESFFWNDDLIRKETAGRQVMGEAREFGLTQGFTMTLPSLGNEHVGFSIAGERLELAPADRRNLALVASFVVYRALRIRRSLEGGRLQGLTRRERQVLQLAAEGWREWQIAEQLGVSDHAVDKYLRACRNKLQSRNTSQAIAIGMRNGILL